MMTLSEAIMYFDDCDFVGDDASRTEAWAVIKTAITTHPTTAPCYEGEEPQADNKQSTSLCDNCQRNVDISCDVRLKCIYFIPKK